jgi:cysteine desulfurase
MQYFDHNATTPLSEVAKRAWLEAVDQYPGNPSSPHRMGTRADRALTEARESLASILGTSPLDLVWTSGATEASNMVFSHYAKTLAESEPVWVSAIEHPCVLLAAERFLGDRVRRIPVSSEGVIERRWMEEQAKAERPSLVVAMAVNNETGVIQPWRSVQEWCQENRVPFFCDAAQWIGKYPSTGLGDCDWTMGCAHKFGGPNGVGFLKCPSSGPFHSLFAGGPQEMSRRAGTENLGGVLSMVAAVEEREALVSEEWLSGRIGIRDSIGAEVVARLPGTRILGRGADRTWNTLALVMPDCDCRFRWVVKLDRLGFAVSTGSACSSGKEKPSHVLEAMGLSSSESSRVIRCSSGPDTSAEDWMKLVDAMVTVNGELSA